MWMKGIMIYAIAGPLVWITAVLFYSTHLKRDMFCTVADFGYEVDMDSECNELPEADGECITGLTGAESCSSYID